MQDPLALQAVGALADLVDQRAADDAGVVGEVLLGDGDGLEHSATVVVRQSAIGNPVGQKINRQGQP